MAKTYSTLRRNTLPALATSAPMLRVYLSTISKTVGLMKDAHLDASRMMEYLKFIVNDPLTEEALLLDEIKTEDRVRFLKALFS